MRAPANCFFCLRAAIVIFHIVRWTLVFPERLCIYEKLAALARRPFVYATYAGTSRICDCVIVSATTV